MHYDGYLDVNDGWRVSGWAYDARSPNDPVEIAYEVSTGETGIVSAADFRPDLLQHGLGNGRHAFSFELPIAPERKEAVTVSARIKGTDFVLKGSPMRKQPPLTVALIAGDIVNNCNLRCPFCVVDYSNIRGLKLMAEDTFEKMFDLLPGLPRGNFWLSCLHEPTMHPKFIDFIEKVPRELRDRISFTTNLSRRLPDDFFPRLANSGIHSIRISYDSRNPELFAELRSGAKYPLFESNVARLVEQLERSANRPHLRFITMAFRENQGEIRDLILHCREKLQADSHEIRFMFYLPHLARWGKEHILADSEWTTLERSLLPLKSSHNLDIMGPYEGVRDQFEAAQGLESYVARETAFGGAGDAMDQPIPAPQEVAPHIPDDALRLRMRWDGLLGMDNCPEDIFGVNVKHLPSPSDYFYRLRMQAKLARAAAPCA